MTDLAPNGLILAAASSNSGKTMLSLGLQRLLVRNNVAVAPAKCGPDYIDPAFHKAASHKTSINLDPWAMIPEELCTRAFNHASGADIFFCEGVMGLFDGAAGGKGSTASLAKILNLPVILVLDVKGQAQTSAALIYGLKAYDPDLRIAGVILNRVGSIHHESLLKEAIEVLDIPVIGAVRNNPDLEMPSRHLGLVQADEYADLNARIDQIADHIEPNIDLKRLIDLAQPLNVSDISAVQKPGMLPPLGQHIAIAKDAAFTFIYPHVLSDWQDQGAEISFFSPLNDEVPHPDADAIYLPGGYPELHLEQLAAANRFKMSMREAASNNIRIFGECGGFMVLGKEIIGKDNNSEAMLNLLPITTSFYNPKLHLGYRALSHDQLLPWASNLVAHEFHYANIAWQGEAESLFHATNASGKELSPMGLRVGSVMGSFAHIIGAKG
jgi:cobyrinic acid a,c-diamide synthase